MNTDMTQLQAEVSNPRAAADFLDQHSLATLAHWSQGLAPASLVPALVAWLTTLASSPGTQLQLAWHAASLGRRCLLAGASPTDEGRFNDPTWQKWPWAPLASGHEAAQQWWSQASQIDGLSPHVREQIGFYARRWLDMMAPSNTLLTNPLAIKTAVDSAGASLVRGLGLMSEDALKGGMSRSNGADTAHLSPARGLATTPGRVVLRNHLVELIQYEPTTPNVLVEPVLIIPSCIMKYYILDLSPHNSMVRWLVDQGHTVYIVSWRNPDESDAHIGFDDYVRQGVLCSLDWVRQACAQRVHLVGYCLGGTFSTVAAAHLSRSAQAPEPALASLTLLAAETDYSQPGEMGVLIDEAQVRMIEAAMKRQGFLSGRQMAESFQFLHASDLVWARRTQRWLMGKDVAENDLMAWNADTTRLPATMHSQYLRRFYLDNALASGRLKFEGRTVHLRDIRLPLFVVGTEKDHVSPWKSVYKVHQLVSGHVRFVLTNGGHNAGIVSEPGHAGRRYRMADTLSTDDRCSTDAWQRRCAAFTGSWWTAWNDWLRENGTGATQPARAVPVDPDLPAAPGSYVMVRYAE